MIYDAHNQASYKLILCFAGHIYRHDDQPVHQLLFWTPKHGKRSVGGPALTYVDVLCKDTGLSVAELRSLMADRVMGGDCEDLVF